MLTQLTPEQIAGHWSEIKTHLETALVPFVDITPTTINNIFESFLAGRAQLWIMWQLDNEAVKVYGMGSTFVQTDAVSGTKNLLIYTISGYTFIPQELWKDAFDKIMEFAKVNNCAKLVAYSQVPRILEIVKQLGGEAKTTYIEWRCT